MDGEVLRHLFGPVPGRVAIVANDAARTLLAASDGILEALGGTPAAFGHPLREVLAGGRAHDSVQARTAEAIVGLVDAARAAGAQRLLTGLAWCFGDAGPAGPWDCRATPVPGEAGAAGFVVLACEPAAAGALADPNTILESITEGVFTLDREWRFGFVNGEGHRILGRNPGELVGKVIGEEFPAYPGSDFERHYQAAMHERRKTAFTAFYPPLDAWYDVTAYPTPEGVAVYFRDVSARVAIEAERERLVRESEQQRRIYEAALDSTPDFFYVFGLDHGIVYANESLRRMWGVPDPRGQSWIQLGYEQWHAELHDREIDQVVATRAPIRGEVPFTGTNGRRVYDYIFAPVFGPDGEVVAVAGTTRDVTERQSAEQAIREHALQLAASDRSKDEFLATLSHELRNPLAPLRNAIELLRRTAGGSPAAAVHAIMERQVNHLVRLVDDLLEVSRISRGTFSLRSERVELAAVVHHALETSQPVLAAARHALTVELPEDPVWLVGDTVRLAQILANLLNNAAKYTEDGGRIELRAWCLGDEAVVSVRDNGIGVAPDLLPRMFEMFTRGDRDSGRSQGGLGIGLALARRLAEMHGGSLVAHSDGPGLGSEFVVRLPLADPPEVAEADAGRGEGTLAGKRVLVVDDNHDAGDSLGMVLGLLGANVRIARDGAEALEVFEAYLPSIVLLDIGMPGMNGYDVAQLLRARHPGRKVTLVALTGWGQEDDRRRAREAGFDHHLVKPAELGELQQLLATLD
jgi:PAS domain S-box-containing protein